MAFMTPYEEDSGETALSPAPSRSKRYARQRDRILDAATTLLNEKGVAGLTLQDVARELGLKTASITYYFRFKEQLITAVFEESLEHLAAMASEAATRPTPRERVDHYLKLYFDRRAASLRKTARPMANLSEIRGLDEEARSRLIAQYQKIFRTVRRLLEPDGSDRHKYEFTPKVQILNETLFWSDNWLQHYAIADFDNVRLRLSQILTDGIAEGAAPVHPILYDQSASDTDNGNANTFLKIATKLINDVGYRGASIQRISGEMNLTKGSFYHHLEAKDDLVLECFRNSYRRLGEIRNLASADNLSKWETLVAIISSATLIQFDGAYPLLRFTALQVLPAAVRDIPLERSNRTTLFLAGLIVEAIQEGKLRKIDPLLASHVIVSAINAAYDIRNWASKQEREKSVADYLNIIMNGLLPSAAI